MFSHHHPDVHGPAQRWSENETLHVAAVYSNPFRWETRRRLANDFRRHLAKAPNVELHFVELAYGDRPFEVTGEHRGDIQLRTSHEFFHKENLGNIGVRAFPPGWKCGAIVDADFSMTRHDWALEAIHQLQTYEWVQLFSSYTNLSGKDLGRGHRVLGSSNGFAYNYHQNGYGLPDNSLEYAHKHVGATGGCWAFRRSAFDTVGGFLDRCILGSADWIMAFALVGEAVLPQNFDRYTPGYQRYILEWTRRAARCTRNIGYVDQHVIHHFHGPKARRGYTTRDEILIGHCYDPERDVFPDWQGVLQLTPDKPRFRDAIRGYFLARREDYPAL